eukprot:3654542-Pleurochrysis_carterae.AAC.3
MQLWLQDYLLNDEEQCIHLRTRLLPTVPNIALSMQHSAIHAAQLLNSQHYRFCPVSHAITCCSRQTEQAKVCAFAHLQAVGIPVSIAIELEEALSVVDFERTVGRPDRIVPGAEANARNAPQIGQHHGSSLKKGRAHIERNTQSSF